VQANQKHPTIYFQPTPPLNSPQTATQVYTMSLNISEDIDIKVDFSFKKVFGNPQHTRLLINLLNGLFKTSHDTLIQEVTILNPALEREQIDDKACILDIRATTDQGEHINIEMQIINRRDWIERSLYYWSKLYEQQLQSGDNYHQLQRTLSISFLNFKLFDRPRGLSIYQLRERDDHELLTPLMQLFFIELPKLPNALTELDQDLKEWVMFMNATNPQERQAVAAKNAYIQEAQKLLELIAQNPEDRIRYESRLKGLRDYHSGLAAERHVGRQEGVQIGRQEGVQIGRQETQREIAMTLLSQGVSIEVIATATGLTVDAIKNLQH
jgi:predicted transposase/invertase (TIGR01784 family)